MNWWTDQLEVMNVNYAWLNISCNFENLLDPIRVGYFERTIIILWIDKIEAWAILTALENVVNDLTFEYPQLSLHCVPIFLLDYELLLNVSEHGCLKIIWNLDLEHWSWSMSIIQFQKDRYLFCNSKWVRGSHYWFFSDLLLWSIEPYLFFLCKKVKHDNLVDDTPSACHTANIWICTLGAKLHFMNLLVKGRFNFMNFHFFLCDIVYHELVFAIGYYESKLLIKNYFFDKS